MFSVTTDALSPSFVLEAGGVTNLIFAAGKLKVAKTDNSGYAGYESSNGMPA